MKRISRILSILLVLSMVIAPISMADKEVIQENPNTIEVKSEIAIIVFDEDGEYEVILEPQEVTIDKEDEEPVKALDQLRIATDGELVEDEQDWGIMIEYILGTGCPDTGGWMFTVNGEEPQVGVGEAEIKEGDQVIWRSITNFDNYERDQAPTWKELLGEEVEETEEEEIENKFKDLDSHKWAVEEIEAMAGKGIITGTSEDTFDPTANITRGQFATLISRMFEYDGSSIEEIPFEDVAKDKYYYNSVAAVYEKGLINGKTETTFGPEETITRQEMSKIIGSILENNDYEKQGKELLSKFSDSNSIATWAEEGAAIVVHNEIILGSDDKFNPKGQATRAEAAVMLYRLNNLLMD